eukprot:1607049-Alexandrium_andersonii.AAC.1
MFVLLGRLGPRKIAEAMVGQVAGVMWPGMVSTTSRVCPARLRPPFGGFYSLRGPGSGSPGIPAVLQDARAQAQDVHL